MDAFAASHSPSISATILVCALALSVFFIEVRRKTTAYDNTVFGSASLLKTLHSLGKELVAFLLCGVLIVGLLMRRQDLGWSADFYATHDVYGNEIQNTSLAVKHAEINARIATDWGILGCADTLLAMQAMIRVIMVVSHSCRVFMGEKLEVTGGPSAFFLLASVCRLLVLAFSPLDAFYLDGPLGGKLNVAFEAAAVPLLIYLSVHGARRWSPRDLIFGLICILTSLSAAYSNQFQLAYNEKQHLDALFSLVQVLDVLAVANLLCRSIAAFFDACIQRSWGAVVVYMGLPVQQGLAAYFFLVAFSAPLHPEPKLVRYGRPFELMWVCGALQVGCSLLAAAALYTASVDENPGKSVHATSEILLEQVDV